MVEVLEELLKEVLFPLVTCSNIKSTEGLDMESKINLEEKLAKKISPSLRMLIVILEVCITMPESSISSIPSLLSNTFEIEPIFKTLLETCEGEALLGKSFVSNF